MRGGSRFHEAISIVFSLHQVLGWKRRRAAYIETVIHSMLHEKDLFLPSTGIIPNSRNNFINKMPNVIYWLARYMLRINMN